MSLRVQAAEVEATYPEPEDAHALKIEGLEATTSTAREGVDHLTEQLQELEVQRTAVKEHLQQLADKEKELEKLIDTVEPRIRYAIDSIKVKASVLKSRVLTRNIPRMSLFSFSFGLPNLPPLFLQAHIKFICSRFQNYLEFRTL